LSPGTRLGTYEVVALLGAGGMGEVYRARDTKLNRDVALKVLLPAVANDPDRLARFSREAQVLASLNHPNIAHIYGIEDAAIVMELVEGEDLAQRIARGAIPLDEALPIARQIAEALEAAHDHSIIHRDLKPANIKVRADGTVKVLDFGLAKAMDPVGVGRNFSSADHIANSPTLSLHATEAGLILGTAAYMSPEQAAGKAVDKRSDLWAFGVVVMEMLTSRQVFKGETVSHVLAAVLKDEPDWTALPPHTPASIRTLLRRCLEKDRKRRLPDAAAARLEIDDATLAASGDGIRVGAPVSQAAWRRALPWASTGALAAGRAVVLVLWVPWRPSPSPEPLRLSAELGAAGSLTFGPGDATSLSPDGAVVAFVAQTGAGGNPQLYVRRLSHLQASPLSGTDDAASPFFSPDGQWVAFFAGGKLKKINVTGGAVVTLCDAAEPRGGAWGEDEMIVFQPNLRGGLMRVSSTGGTPAPLTALAEDEVTQRWPQILPGGQAVLFTSGNAGIAYDAANLVVQALATGARTVVQRGGYHGRYLPSGFGSPDRAARHGGHLVYMHDGTLFAAPFDLERLSVTGPPVPALEGVATNESSGGAQFAVSASGTVVYLPGQSSSGSVPIQWMDHAGKTTTLRATPANWFNLLVAPDGRRLAFQIIEGQSDIWVYEWARDTLTRLTFDSTTDSKPVWTPDGRRLVFSSARADKSTGNLYWQHADGSGDAQRLTESKNFQQPASWHPSGRFLAFEEQHPQTDNDLMILPMAGDEASGWKPGTPTVFLNSPFTEREPMFSPDGRWIAYASNESGRFEVYVRPHPGPGGKWQISAGGGVYPTWSRTTRELFYGTPNRQIMIAPFGVEGDSFRAGKPRLWSEVRYLTRGANRMFDLHPDGTRFALAPVEQTPGVTQGHVTFLFNFFDELRRIAPVAK